MVYGIETSSKAEWIEWLSAQAYIYVCANDPPNLLVVFFFNRDTSMLSIAPENIRVEITVCYCILLLLLLFDAIILYR